MAHTILRTKEVIAKTKLGRTTLHEKVRDNTFPKPVPLGGRAVGWIESEVDAWIEALMKARDSNYVGESVGENSSERTRPRH
ncbi:AlpA family transcriptional regulator [Herbaspirillum rubrisubalbicans]|uniref:AlpA family transcriptional regulator n=2 Tax=Herbaspirillum rubrisubalbicans TaxID=80842 RepID=A0AAD0UH62_9BURK|nr:AlpA family transcriptional regulator [Herbaspirillum rubrisubalbicans]